MTQTFIIISELDKSNTHSMIILSLISLSHTFNFVQTEPVICFRVLGDGYDQFVLFLDHLRLFRFEQALSFGHCEDIIFAFEVVDFDFDAPL